MGESAAAAGSEILDDVFDAALGGYVDHTRFELDLFESVGHGEEKLFGPFESRP